MVDSLQFCTARGSVLLGTLAMLKPWIATATHNAVTRTLSPIADDVSFKDAADNDNSLLYEKTLASTLSLVGDDYHWLNDIDRCESVSLSLERGAYVFSGTIGLNDLEWRSNRCSVDISLSSSEPHSCLDDMAKEKVDLLRSTTIPRQNVSITAGDVEFFSPALIFQINFFGSSPTSVDGSFTPPAGSNWTVVQRQITNIVPTGGGFYNGDVSITYARVTVTAAVPPGDGWTNEGGNLWSRTPVQANATFSGDVNNGPILYNAEVFSSSDIIDNCLFLNDVFEWFADRCGFTYQSVFFGAGAPAVADPVIYPSDVYDIAYERFHNIVIAQKSDVKRFNDLNNASKAIVGWDDLTALLKLFKCKWEVSVGVLRVEHASYFQRTTGLDFTAGAFSSYTSGKWTVKGLGDSLPDQQDFAWMDESDAIFDGVPITYDCNSSADPEDFPAGLFTSNVAFMLNDNQAVDDIGFAIMAAYEVNGLLSLVNRTNLMFPAQSPINGDLAFPNLHGLLWLHDGNYATGTINEQPVTFLSTAPQQETSAEVIICFDDYESWDRSERIATPYGDMQVIEATYSDKTSRFTVTMQG